MKVLFLFKLLITGLVFITPFQLKADYPLYKHWHIFEEYVGAPQSAKYDNMFIDKNGNILLNGTTNEEGVFNGKINIDGRTKWILSLDKSGSMNWLKYHEFPLIGTTQFTAFDDGSSYHLINPWEEGDMGEHIYPESGATMVILGIDKDGNTEDMLEIYHNTGSGLRFIASSYNETLYGFAFVTDSMGIGELSLKHENLDYNSSVYLLAFDKSLELKYASEPLFTTNTGVSTSNMLTPTLFASDMGVKAFINLRDSIFLEDTVIVPEAVADGSNSFGLLVMDLDHSGLMTNYEVFHTGKSYVENIVKGNNDRFYIQFNLQDSLSWFGESIYEEFITSALILEMNEDFTSMMNKTQLERITPFKPIMRSNSEGIYLIDGSLSPAKILLFAYESLEKKWEFASTNNLNVSYSAVHEDGTVYLGLAVAPQTTEIEFPGFSIETDDFPGGLLLLKLHPEDNTNIQDDALSLAASMDIYPNPAGDNVNIKVQLPEPTIGSLVVKDLYGRSLIKIANGALSKNETYRIDLSSLSGGMYLVVLQSAEYNYVSPLLKIE